MQSVFHRTIQDWRTLYDTAENTAVACVTEVRELCDEDDSSWIYLVSPREIADQAARIEQAARDSGIDPRSLPLYGVPFAIKDNIDVAGLPTTAGCPDYSYIAAATAPAVQYVLDAGAILIGKTNLDQFATGLVGVRSPYGAVPNPFDGRYICGGSSSGSASVVARGIVPFALGTDTAGSGRVPAGFTNIVGLKPTRGHISTRGIVSACRTLDCVSVFALTLADAQQVLRVAGQYDDEDPYSRIPASSPIVPLNQGRAPRIAVPEFPKFFGDSDAEEAFAAGLDDLRAAGAEIRQVDFTPLHTLAGLLYDGPWIAERYAVIKEFFHTSREAIDPVVAGIIARAEEFSAVEVFLAEYKRREIAAQAARLFRHYDALAVPTSPTIYTIEQIRQEPVTLNSRLGTYTNFVNLADWCALAVPGRFRSDGLPSGITLIGPAWADEHLLDIASRYCEVVPWQLGSSGRGAATATVVAKSLPGGTVVLAAVGAHMQGLPLNYELQDHGGRYLETTRTTNDYRMHLLNEGPLPKPGLVRAASGVPQELELWELPLEKFGSFVAGIPAPLGIGSIALHDGRTVLGFLCEHAAAAESRDISSFGGWRSYIRHTEKGDQ